MRRRRLLAIKDKRFLLIIFAVAMLLTVSRRACAEPVDAQPLRVLALTAHPDDELLIVNLLREEVRAGNRLFGVWTTSGDAAGSAPVREEESRTVMDMLGADRDDLYFLRFPDGASHEHIVPLVEKALELVAELAPDRVYCNAYEGGHIDHDVVSFACSRAAAELGPGVEFFEFPLYNNYDRRMRLAEFAPHPDAEPRGLVLDREALDFKVECLEAYASQARTLQAMKFLLMATAAVDFAELYRPLVAHDYLEPPHSGLLLYELQRRHEFDEFRAAVEAWFEARDYARDYARD